MPDTKPPKAGQQGIAIDERGQEEPTDSSRAQHKSAGQAGLKEQREAALQQPPGPGEPAGGE